MQAGDFRDINRYARLIVANKHCPTLVAIRLKNKQRNLMKKRNLNRVVFLMGVAPLVVVDIKELI